MSRSWYKLIVAVLGGFLLTTPFIILEWINTPDFRSMGIPPLFFVMWLSGSIFTYTFVSFLPDLQNKKKAKTNLFFTLLKVALLLLMAWIFIGLVIDQWHCFMGVPNCD